MNEEQRDSLRFSSSIIIFFGCIYILGLAVNREEKVSVTVDSVRVVTRTQEKTTKGGNPGVNAVIGGLVAGTVGAVAGAVLTSPMETTEIRDMSACLFTAKVDGETKSFLFYDSRVEQCALLREGDVVTINKTVSRLWGSRVTAYDWFGFRL